MKKRMKHLMSVLMVLLACLICPACSSDDDDDSDETTPEVTEKTMGEMLEGIWQDKYFYYKFYKDGTGEWIEDLNADGKPSGWRYYFNWTYDPNTNILALRFEEDEDDNEDILIVSISEHYLKVKWQDSDGSWFDSVDVLPRIE
jgi:hypothetical protein